MTTGHRPGSIEINKTSQVSSLNGTVEDVRESTAGVSSVRLIKEG